MSIRNADTISIDLRKILDERTAEALEKGIDQKYADSVKDKIVKRTQLGIGVDPETGASYKFPKLSENYKEARRGEARWYTLSDGRIIKVGGKAKTAKALKPDSEKNKRKQKSRIKKAVQRVKRIFSKKKKAKKKPEKRLSTLASTTTPSKSNLTATGQLLRALSTVRLRNQSGKVGFKIVVGDRRGKDLFGYPARIGNKALVKILEGMDRVFMGFTKSQKNEISREIRQIIRKYIK